MCRTGILLFVLGWAFSGCGDDGHTVLVGVRTDMVPGVEFSGIEVELADGRQETIARFDMDFIGGRRVASFSGLSAGTAEGIVRLVLPDGVVAERRFVLEVRTDPQVTTVLLSRDCRGVACPGSGSPVATACLAGQCVDPRCTQETPEFCAPAMECTNATDCPNDGDACSAASCIAGACFYGDGGECDEGFYCHPEQGCLVAPISMADAGVDAAMSMDGGTDAGSDAGGTDAGPDAPSDAGTDSAMDVPAEPELEACVEEDRGMLWDGYILAAADGEAVSGQIILPPELSGVTPLAGIGPVGRLILTSDGAYDFFPAAEGRLEVAIRSGEQRGCLVIHVVPSDIKRFTGDEWSRPGAWEPDGVPMEGEEVFVPPGANLVYNTSFPMPNAIYVATGAILELPDGSFAPRGSVLVGGRINGLLDVAEPIHLAGNFDRARFVDTMVTAEGPVRFTRDVDMARTMMASEGFRWTVGGTLSGTEIHVQHAVIVDVNRINVTEYNNEVSGGALIVRGETATIRHGSGVPMGGHVIRFLGLDPIQIRLDRAWDLDLGVEGETAAAAIFMDDVEVTNVLRSNRQTSVAGVTVRTNVIEVGPGFVTGEVSNYMFDSCRPVYGAGARVCGTLMP